MRKRYITKPKASSEEWWENYEPLLPNLTVHEPSTEPSPTGLLNKNGDELFSVADKPKMGFLRRLNGQDQD